MKKILIFIVTFIILFIGTFTVNAKDSTYSFNKYNEEILENIEISYNEKGVADGFIVIGKYKDEDKTNKDYQGLITKYNKSGKIIWEYSNDKNTKDIIDAFTYTYDLENKVDGYLLVIKRTIINEETTSNEQKVFFVKLSLTGKTILEKEIEIDNYEIITKIVPVYNSNNEKDGYIGIGAINIEEQKTAILLRIDNDLNIIFKKEADTSSSEEITYKDLINIRKDNSNNFLVIESHKNEMTNSAKIVKFDNDGNKEIQVDNLDKYTTYNFAPTSDGYILYGVTSLVKVEGGKYSYYLVKYDENNNELWETIGDIATSDKVELKLLPILNKEKKSEYFLLYQNASDNSKEVIKLDSDGLLVKKVKKINNEYYTLKDFKVKNEVLYFTGYITCPEDDNCGYKSHSLFLISDEDKVIEVKKESATNFSLIFLLLIIILFIAFYIKKRLVRRNLKNF